MTDSTDQTPLRSSAFDPDAIALHLLIHDRRCGGDRREADGPGPTPERRRRKERRRRVDPTTFEKQYTDDELEFMTAMQQFKTQSGQPFPTHGEVLRVAARLGYRKEE